MSMHLLPTYYTTTSTRKRKSRKKTQSQLRAESTHAKFLKRMGYTGQGNAHLEIPDYKSDRQCSPTSDVIAVPGSGKKRRENKYTGTLVKGIAQMHKSNAVPVISKEDAINVANMRRN
ncbi:MAG: hypothetical protein VW270_19450 [Candidatus Poseidoniales archaeon]|jgi:hypothetical protein